LAIDTCVPRTVARRQPAGRGSDAWATNSRRFRAGKSERTISIIESDQADDRSEVLRRIVLEVLEQGDVGRLRGVV